MKPLKKPETEKTGLVDLQPYHRPQVLTPEERKALADLNERFDTGLKTWPKMIYAALSQLLQPIYELLRITKAAKAPRNSVIHLLVQEMRQRQKPYWAWTEDEWLEVLCPTERDFHLRQSRFPKEHKIA